MESFVLNTPYPKISIRSVRRLPVVAACSLLLLGGVSVLSAKAENTPQAAGLSDVASQTVASEQQTRTLQRQWSDEERALLAKIDQLTRQEAMLGQQVERLDHRLQQKQEQIDAQTRRAEKTEKLRQGLQNWFQISAQELEQNLAASQPFLADERRKRLDDLHSVLLDGDIAVHEQFRRLMEVFQVEAEYGYTCEVYRDKITIDQQQREVDMLRLGRLSLFFTTPDGEQGGVFDPLEKRFVYLPDSMVADLNQARQQINGQTSEALTLLPVGRIQP
nr:DUF3450 domain-containing protein [Desulfuromonas acetoxidans]